MSGDWPLDDPDREGATMEQAPLWITIGVFLVGGLATAQWLSSWASEPWVYGGTHCAASAGVLGCTGYAPIGITFILAVSVVAAMTAVHNYREWRYGEPENADKEEADP